MTRRQLFGTVLTAAILFGNRGFAALAAEPREADHAALRELKAKVTAAMNAQDFKALATHFAREFAFTTADQTLITTLAELTAYYDRIFHQGKTPARGIEIAPEADVLTHFLGPDVGYCYGTSKDTYTLESGKKVTMPSRWTATVVREDGQWKIAAVHASVNFLDNPANPPGEPWWSSVKRMFGSTP